MIVSHNELVAAVNKAFLGMQRSCGEADVIANMVADLQMIGMNGVRHFNNENLFHNTGADSAVSVTSNTDSEIEVALHNGSVACHLPAVLDFVLEKMVSKQSIAITLTQCHNRLLAYSELLRLAGKGIACRAQWMNPISQKHTMYVLNRGQIMPEVFFADMNEGKDIDHHSMIIELSVNDFDLELNAIGFTEHIKGNDLKKIQKKSWEEGIFVEDDEWEVLKQRATVFLVENSERSALGAGEVLQE